MLDVNTHRHSVAHWQGTVETKLTAIDVEDQPVRGNHFQRTAQHTGEIPCMLA